MFQDPLPAVRAHEPSLTQAISNLLTNAIKFVPEGSTPKLQVWSEARNRNIRIWIKDNGIGIQPEFQNKIFGMFERGHQDKRYEGTGIGLAIVRKAVEKMNGKTGVESDGINWQQFLGSNWPRQNTHERFAATHFIG